MTEPNETNEEINEELSTDELKSVSGGLTYTEDGANRLSNGVDAKGSGFGLIEAGDADFRNPKAAGSGMTVQDWKRANKIGIQAGGVEVE